MKYIITVGTNQFFLMFLAIAVGLLIGKIKIYLINPPKPLYFQGKSAF